MTLADTLNQDFARRVVVLPSEWVWTPSPAPGVSRMRLERNGGELARATSLVRFEPGALFPTHEHGGGEELLVVEGSTSDEHGEYLAGDYVRSPPGSRHSLRAGEQGATLFVKLRYFAPTDLLPLCVRTRSAPWRPGVVPGLSVLPLHEHEAVSTALVRWAPDTRFALHRHGGGEEIFVIEGTFHDEHGVYPKGSWLRSPHLSAHAPFTADDGATIFVKVGHVAALAASSGEQP
ncbi:cupin domain-containing protein [soil metagenome]